MRAAGEPTRLRTLALLAQGDLTVSELTHCLDQSQPRVSRHLRVLADAGLIAPYQEGSWRFYRLGEVPPWLMPIIETLEGEDVERDRLRLQAVRAERQTRADQYFAQHAEEWDALRQLHIDDRLIEDALLALAPSHVETLYDFGTGTGRMLVVFKDRYSDGRGFDASPEMLSIARVRLAQEGITHARVRREDIISPQGLPAEAADLICLHHVLHFLGEPEKAIANAAAALCPGGTLLIADFAPHAVEVLRERFAHRRLGFDSAEIEDYAARCGLLLDREQTLDPGPEGNLVSRIWRMVKPIGSSGIPRSQETVSV
jgi:ArsR family transcriptional regulator